jgi:hypothetical protein
MDYAINNTLMEACAGGQGVREADVLGMRAPVTLRSGHRRRAQCSINWRNWWSSHPADRESAGKERCKIEWQRPDVPRLLLSTKSPF